MKRLLAILMLCLAAIGNVRAADGDLFPYPIPPDDMERLDERCDFIITRFWRPVDFKSAMSKTEKLRSTFADWVTIMPYATADTVHAAIDRLIASVAKSGPHTLMLAQMAEQLAYSDSAVVYSSEIFLPFARAAAAHKKINADDRRHFALMAQRIENTQIRKPLRHLTLVEPDGKSLSLDNINTQMTVLVFAPHSDSNSSMDRVRLSADYNINQLIEQGLLTLIYIEPAASSASWVEQAAMYPANWVVAASADADDYFELKTSPTILLLDGRHKVLAKDLNIDALIATIARIREQMHI